jgi:DHA1 family inner membrane transport protein
LACWGLVIPTGTGVRKDRTGTAGFRQMWQVLGQSRAAVGALIYGFFLAVANDAIFVVYGAWLEQNFGLGLVALGSATMVIGIAELSGETLTATLADRLGLQRAIVIGAGLTALSYFSLPFTGHLLGAALAALFFSFICFEFTIVTSFSLITEILPTARGTMMSAFLATSSLGRMLGAFSGGVLWLWGGMPAIGTIAAGLTIVGLIGFMWGMRNWR